MKRRIIITLTCLFVVILAFWAAWYVLHQRKQQHIEVQEMLNEHPTDGVGYEIAITPYADPLIVGEWQSASKPGWHKVYYDDFDEEAGLFWGKEWDETEDVMEEDLNYHGNGWFRWEKKKNILHEFATMDERDVPIHRAYQIQQSNTDSLVYFEKEYKKNIYRFSHSEN